MLLIDDEDMILQVGRQIADGQAAEIPERGCAGFMQKPFSLSELSRKIEEIISE